MTYNFYGWETADIPPVNDLYPFIRNPRDLYDALRSVWSAETCSPSLRENWTPHNPTLGQCSTTAFLAQDIFGGKVYGIALPGGALHCYNVAGGRRFDLTSEQFGRKVHALAYDDANEQTRDTHFIREEKRRRYEALKAGLVARAPVPDDL